MTSSFKIRQAIFILFVSLLPTICGCFSSGNNMSNSERIRARILKYPTTNPDAVEKSIYTSLKNKQYDEAIKQCKKLRETHPDDDNIYLLEGWAYLRKGEYPSSIDRFSRIINSDKIRGDVY